MDQLYLQSWWVLALRGGVAIVFGVLAVIWPDLTLLALVALFAAYALLNGAVSVIGAIRNRQGSKDWWLLFFLGVVGVGAGTIAVIYPTWAALVLVLLMGANALVTGMLDITAAIRLRKVIRGEWLLIVHGILSILFGIFVLLFPHNAGALALVWLISFYAIFTGTLLLALALRMRARTRQTPQQNPTERSGSSDHRGTQAHP